VNGLDVAVSVAVSPDGRQVFVPSGNDFAVFAPEPERGLAASALVALAVLARRRALGRHGHERADPLRRHEHRRTMGGRVLAAHVAGALAAFLGATRAEAILTWPTSPPCNTTLQACIDSAASGDTVEIATNLPIAESISFAKGLTLRAAQGFHPLFSGDQTITASPSASGSQTIRIEGLTLQSGEIQVIQAGLGMATVEIVNNAIQSAQGIVVRTANGTGAITFLISGNTATLAPSSLGIEIDAGTSSSVSGSITGNTIVSQQPTAIAVLNDDQAISVDVIANHVSGTGYGGGVFLWQRGAGTMTARVLDNLVTGASRMAAAGVLATASVGTLQARVVNNTLTGNAMGIAVDGRPDLGAVVTGVVANNAITGSSFSGLNVEPAVAASVPDRNNLYFGNAVDLGTGESAVTPGPSSVFANPLFVGSGNEHLLPGSPAHDAGDDGAVPADLLADLDGDPRIQGHHVDIGAPAGGGHIQLVAPFAFNSSLSTWSGPSSATLALDFAPEPDRLLLGAVAVAVLCGVGLAKRRVLQG
jgi:hypothetical protein